MPINLDELGLDRSALEQLLRDSPGRVKLRLGDGKIVDLLSEHLANGLDVDSFGKVTIDDHSRVTIRDDPGGFEKIGNQHDRNGKVGDKFGQLVNPGKGVFIGDLTEAELLQLRKVAGDLIKEKDFTIVTELLKKG